MVVGLRNALRAERVRGDYVGACLKILAVDIAHHVWARDVKHIVVALHQSWCLAVAIATEVLLGQRVLLYHGAHRTIEYHYPVFNDFV